MKLVVVGQGYVGLPLARAAVRAGHSVVGLDANNVRVDRLNAGESVVDDISASDIVEMIACGYVASTDVSVYSQAEVVVICVPTPLRDGREPDLSAVIAAADAIAHNVRPGALVILESTTYPGTTQFEMQPLFEKAGFEVGKDLFLAFSPERIDPGNRNFDITNTPKIVGADDAMSREKAVAFYRSFVSEVVEVAGSAEAEMTKLLENTYRHVNIGLVNELAIVCHELNIDIWQVIHAAATKPFGYQPFYPGPGVGGHCIPIDPNYLNSRVRKVLDRPFRFVELAEDINAAMPSYVVSRVQSLLNDRRKPLRDSSVLLLGVTYKSGIADTRESPASDVAHLLEKNGAKVSYFDEFVDRWVTDFGETYSRVEDVEESARMSDITVLLQHSPSLDESALAESANLFLDTRGLVESSRAHRL